ncbi:hypothetical protein B0O99DRAFT_679938 [Bisporella sp. PMI_857]|nr:hypothetical protein B0O99DRAFT_679938 [Bisporella sp. PMI_857]
MSFGWSVGDLLAAAEFIVEVAKALDEVDGAGKEFREAVAFLRRLNTALWPPGSLKQLDSRPAFKIAIENEVTALRGPVESFINDVQGFQETLGTIKQGHFRHFQNVPSKLKWHFSTSKKALALKNEVDGRLAIIDTITQRLIVDMLNTCQDFKGDVEKIFSDRLMLYMPVFQKTLVSELFQLQDSAQNARDAKLLQKLEELFDRHFSTQTANFHPLPSVEQALPSSTSSSVLKDIALHLEAQHQIPLLKDSQHPIVGIEAEFEIIMRIQSWLQSDISSTLLIQSGQSDFEKQSLAADMVSLASEAGVPFVAYFCQRVDLKGQTPGRHEILVDLVYSLIYQLCKYSDSANKISTDLSIPDVSILDSSLNSLPEALEVLDKLFSLQNGCWLVVLDGMDILDYNDDPLVEKCLKTLIQMVRKKHQHAKIKALVTTEEHSQTVVNEIGWENVVDANDSNGSYGFLGLEDLATILQTP